jgi:hypothetical protein
LILLCGVSLKFRGPGIILAIKADLRTARAKNTQIQAHYVSVLREMENDLRRMTAQSTDDQNSARECRKQVQAGTT